MMIVDLMFYICSIWGVSRLGAASNRSSPLSEGVEAVMSKPLVWESVSWRRGEEQYRFDVERGGLFATLSAPNGKAMTLPMVVWEGLVDALKAEKTTKTRSENQQQYPSRSRARWYDGEVAEVAESYRAGRSIAEIAHAHNRSAYSIEAQLDKLGLISTAAIYGPGPDGRGGPSAANPSSNPSRGSSHGGVLSGGTPAAEDASRWPPPPIEGEAAFGR
jgi:hypothetical protein